MIEVIFSLNEAQFQKLLAAQPGLWPVLSVFVSAFLAIVSGILVERIRAWFERRKTVRERQQHEIQQINTVISGLTFNIELLFHVASQNILPHYQDTKSIASEIDKDINNDDHVRNVAHSLSQYPCLFLTFPEIYLIEYDFSDHLPFIIEKDAEIVKHSGWLVNGVRELKSLTANRNRCIDGSLRVIDISSGANLEQFRSVVRLLRNIANTECVVSSQLFDVLLKLVKTLEEINENYKIIAKKSKIILPKALHGTIQELKRVSEAIPMPGDGLQTSAFARAP